MKFIFSFIIATLCASALAHPYNGKNHRPLAYDDSTMHCFDPVQEIEIGFYIAEEVEIYPGMPARELLNPHPENKIKVYFWKSKVEIAFNDPVLALADGAGNTEYILYAVNQNLRVFDKITLYYDHEEGFLRGKIIFTPQDSHLVGAPYQLNMTERMNCYDYTWGYGYM